MNCHYFLITIAEQYALKHFFWRMIRWRYLEQHSAEGVNKDTQDARKYCLKKRQQNARISPFVTSNQTGHAMPCHAIHLMSLRVCMNNRNSSVRASISANYFFIATLQWWPIIGNSSVALISSLLAAAAAIFRFFPSGADSSLQKCTLCGNVLRV